MALDKQKILSELGSVVNQLQSADCGCMGKLFSNSSGSEGCKAMNNSQSCYGGCRHGCCHSYGGYNVGHGQGYSDPCAGEPCTANNLCMGQCNVPKLYDDTYSYLNRNLMQPVMQEVYDDLKSISPSNTIVNNPEMSAKMGLFQSGAPQVQDGMGMQQNQMMASRMGSQMQNTMQSNQMQGANSGYQMQDTMRGSGMSQHQLQGNAMGYPAQKAGEGNAGIPQTQIPESMMGNQMNMSTMGQQLANQNLGQAMGGMGPQIVNMMASSAKAASSNPQGVQLTGSMVTDISQPGQGQASARPISVPRETNQGQYDMKTRMNNGYYNMNTGMNQGLYSTNAIMNQGESNNAYASMNQVQYKATEGISEPQYYNSNAGINQQQYNVNAEMPTNMSYSANPQINSPLTQHMTNSNTTGAFNLNAQNSMNFNNMQQGQESLGAKYSYSKPANQIASANRNYGQHTQGMTKFNDMFPGVTGGDLGFDPMAIAIQMNPANHQKAAVATIQKMMNGDRPAVAIDTTDNSAHMKTAIAGANAAVTNISKANATPYNQQNIPPFNQQALYGQQGTVTVPIAQTQQGNMNAMTPNQQQVYNTDQIPQQQVYNTNQIPQQQVYAADTGAPTMSQSQPPQLIPAQQQYQTYTPRQIIDPNSGSLIRIPNLPPLYEGASGDVDGQIQQQQKQENRSRQPTYELDRMIIKDPIFPVDSTNYQAPPSMKRQKYFEYNTLGQPVQKLPAQLYQTPLENVPQTLSPQPVTRIRNDYARYNLKMTESKTSLMGTRPVGRTPSRRQLQQIYNQYKGSQSYTEQNIKNPSQIATYSERSLNLRQTPLERVGGDTAANNSPMMNQMPEKRYLQSIERIGDTAVSNTPYGDYIPIKEPATKNAKSRNGLQDKVFPTYNGSSAWSFHGDQNAPLSAGYRFRNRVY